MRSELRYTFYPVMSCLMCGADTKYHKILGQRLNRSQGFTPKSKAGITTTVAQCTTCQLNYANPLPVPVDLQDHYGIPPEDYWKPEYFQYHESYFSAEIEHLKKIKPITVGMKALDIGAGIGKCMMTLSRAGFDAYGFEPSLTFYNLAIDKMNMAPDKLKVGSIEDMDYPSESFDFITFGAVLEHLYDPAKSIEKAIRWTKPGGIIHIEVPSSKHLLASLINFYYRLIGTTFVTNLSPMHEPYHLYEFGLKSFEEHARRTGLYTIVSHQYLVCSINPFPKFTHPILRRLMQWTNTGMQLTVWLQRK